MEHKLRIRPKNGLELFEERKMKRAFLFPGQGSQAVGMGKAFYDRFSLARKLFRTADEVLGYPVSKLCFEGPEKELKLTRNAQPALLIVSTIAFRLLGEDPFMAAGHSLGEYSALIAAGALTFEDAVLLVHKRGTYMQEAVPVGEGSMAAILGCSYKEVKDALRAVTEGVVEIANWNSQEQIVIAGGSRAVARACAILKPARSIMLPVSAPFHSRLMKKAADRLAVDLDQTKFKDLRFPVICNVDAVVLRKGTEARSALKRQVTGAVLWYKSMEILKEAAVEQCIELGAGRVLSGLMKRISRRWSQPPQILNIGDPDALDKYRTSAV